MARVAQGATIKDRSMQLAWLTDIHLNFCPGRVQELLDRIDAADPLLTRVIRR